MCVLLDRVVVSQDLHDFVAAYAHKRPSAAIQEILRRARATHTRDGRLDLAVQKGTQKIYMSLMAAPPLYILFSAFVFGIVQGMLFCCLFCLPAAAPPSPRAFLLLAAASFSNLLTRDLA